MEGRKVSDRGFYASVASPKRRPSASNCLHTTAINSGIPMNCSLQFSIKKTKQTIRLT